MCPREIVVEAAELGGSAWKPLVPGRGSACGGILGRRIQELGS